MKNKNEVLPEIDAEQQILSTEPSQRTTSEREAVRCGGEVEVINDAVPQSSNICSEGTMPSNTVPNNCNNSYINPNIARASKIRANLPETHFTIG